MLISCTGNRTDEHGTEGIDRVDLQERINRRLETLDFSLVESDAEVVLQSREILEANAGIPNHWSLRFAGKTVDVPSLDESTPVGVAHDAGRFTCVYLLPDARMPEYTELLPLAVAHYHIPEPQVDIVLLLVCFQADPKGELWGIGVRSVDIEGWDTSSPFAVAVKQDMLTEREIYNEFLPSDHSQAVGARSGWNQGFLLLTKLTDDVVLSSYLPWY